MIVFYLLAASIHVAFASYCGQSAIPFTFQVLRSGHPVLGCARPKCFGWTANGTRAGDSAQFYRVAGKDDGYLRRSDQFIRSPSTNKNFVPQIAICSTEYKSSSCEEGEWVGGLSPQNDPVASEVKMKCCSYQSLINSVDRGRATVKQGQLVVGGEVLQDGQLIAFDYIANIKKEVESNGNVTYYATIKRMPCFDDATVDIKTNEEQVQAVQTTKAVIVQTTPSPVPLNQQQNQPINQQVNGQQQPQYAQNSQPYGQFYQYGYGLNQNTQYQGYTPYPQNYQQPATPQTFPDPLQMFRPTQQQLQPQPQQQAQPQPPLQTQPQPAQPTNGMIAQPQQPQPMALPQLPQYQPQLFPMAPQPMMMPLPIAQPAPQVAPAAAASSAAAATAAGQNQQAGQQQMYAQQPQLLTSTLPPMTLPKLEDLPKLQIPSVDDVEQVIPPVERAILKSVAKFFGVL